MKQRQIEKFNKLVEGNNFNELNIIIKDWFNSKDEERITADDLINACENGDIKASGQIVNNIGFLCSKDSEIDNNSVNAFKLYSFAHTLKHAAASANCAKYYLSGRAVGGENLDLAYKRCQKAIKRGWVDKVGPESLKCKILNKLYEKAQEAYDEKNYFVAFEYLTKIIDAPSGSGNFTQDNVKALHRKCNFFITLGGLYANVKHAENSENEIEENEEVLAPIAQLSNMTINSEKPIFPWLYAAPGMNGKFDQMDTEEIAKLKEFVFKKRLLIAENLETIQHKLESIQDELDVELDIVKKEQYKQECDQLEQNKAELEESRCELKNFLKDFREYINPHKHIIHSQIEAEKRFFNPRRTRKPQTLVLAQELEKRRLEERVLEPLGLTINEGNISPARRMITAERSTIEASVQLLGRPKANNWYNHIGWSAAPKDINGYKFAHTETLQVGSTQIKYRQKCHPHYNHLGDYHMEDIGVLSRSPEIAHSLLA